MVDNYPYALASDFAVNRILKEAPESFHKLDNDDVIQVYMDLFGTDPADDMGMNRGGMMDINRMTAPLGYYRGGVPVDPELYEGYDPILGDWMKDRKMRQAQPPAGAVDMTGQYVAPPERPRWEKLRKLGKKGKDLFTGIFGAKGAEAGPLVDFIKSKRARLISEVQGEMIGNIFGTGVDEGRIKILQIEIDKLTEQLNDLGEN